MQSVVLQTSGYGYGVPSKYRSDHGGKDHLRENVRRMRQIQRQARDKEQETQKPVKAMWKSEKYNGIQSKIREDIEKAPPTPRPHSANFLRAHSRAGPPVKLETRPCTPDPSDKTTVPPASSVNNVRLVRNNIDFIKVNGNSAKHTFMQRSPSLSALEDIRKSQEESFNRHERGEVPKYLRNRQNQWKKEEDERIANTPDPAMPPGHKVLPGSEREETLSLLKKKQSELTHQLQLLPLRNDTYRIRTCKQELETKIAEVEEAIKIFSRPKVFVKVE